MKYLFEPKILSYGIQFDSARHEWIVCEATKFDDLTQKPTSWAVRNGVDVMSKHTGNFEYEPKPSSRDEDFFEEYRFNSADEAIEAWALFHYE